MIAIASLADNVARAFDRIADFEAVQRGAGADELLAAVTRLQESVGIDDEARVVLRERLAARGWSSSTGQVALGLVVGLMAAELRSDAEEVAA